MTRPRFSRIVPELQRQYRERAQAGDWETCCALAVQLAGCDPHVSAEAHHAHGYALERLGERERARDAYQAALYCDRKHPKAQRALTRLTRQPLTGPATARVPKTAGADNSDQQRE